LTKILKKIGFGENIPEVFKIMMTTEIDRWIGGLKNGLMDGKMDGRWTELTKILYLSISENIL